MTENKTNVQKLVKTKFKLFSIPTVKAVNKKINLIISVGHKHRGGCPRQPVFVSDN